MDEEKYTVNEYIQILINSGLSRASLRAVVKVLNPKLAFNFPDPVSGKVKKEIIDKDGNVPW